MCNSVHSESGALCSIDGCAEYDRLLADNVALRYALKYAKFAIETTPSMNGFTQSTALDLIGDAFNGGLDWLSLGRDAEMRKLRDALIAIEWGGIETTDGIETCPGCGVDRCNGKHKPSCPIGNSLKE